MCVLCCIFIPNIFSNCIFLSLCLQLHEFQKPIFQLVDCHKAICSSRFKNYFHSFFSKQIFTNKQTTFSIILCKKV